jgi:hypothetical protein
VRIVISETNSNVDTAGTRTSRFEYQWTQSAGKLSYLLYFRSRALIVFSSYRIGLVQIHVHDASVIATLLTGCLSL